MPERQAQLKVTFFACGGNFVCLDLENAKNLEINQINTETYVKQLENIVNTLGAPVQ